MAIAAAAPIIWGLYTGKMEQAGWIALMAECICWVELKGDFIQRLRLLSAGTALAVFFAILGSISGGYAWLSIGLMVVVGFITSILRNIGDRGSALAICVYALFIFCNAYPVHTLPELEERTILVLIGAGWNAVAAVFASIFITAQQPYKRTIAIIWKSISELTVTISRGWDGTGPRSNEHDIYIKEKAVRTAIDSSLNLFEKTAQEADTKDGHEYILAHVRKAASVVGAQVITISEELSNIDRKQLDTNLRIKIFTMIRALQQAVDRMAVFVITLKPEEELIVKSRINRLYKLATLTREALEEKDIPDKQQILRFVQLTERNARIIESATRNLGEIKNERSMVRSYPLMKTFYILHPKYWPGYIRILFNFNTFTARYALRSAIAAGIAMFIYKWWNIDHGYWIPFTLMIVMQTYFGATLKKSLDRIIGTLAGGLVAGLFLRMPTGLYLQEAMLFLSFIPMVIFIRKKYSVAAFFITLNLVLLFNINKEINDALILTRALSTIAGAALAIVSGFVLLPYWDKKWLPVHMSDAIYNNYQYFVSLFFPEQEEYNWTKYKRKAESGNSNVFESYNRYTHEPGFRKKPYAIFFYIITHNIRITRELNNIRLEQEHDPATDATAQTNVAQNQLIDECLESFNNNISLIKHINPEGKYEMILPGQATQYPGPLSQQQLLYIEKMLIEIKAMNTDLEILREKLPRIMQL